MKGFVICEYEKVKEQFPEFAALMASLELALRAKAEADWDPLRYGGFAPTAGQFGKSTIMPELFYGFGGLATGLPLTTWQSTLTSTGSNILIQGRATGGTIPEDYKIGLAGLAFLDKAVKVTEIKMQIGDSKIPRINLEEAMVYNKPAVIWEQPFIIDEEQGFEVIGYVQSLGIQRIKLIGLELNRIPNKLQVTNTGTALT
jgi:hypothetical protein